ncbi:MULTISPECIES: response regulator transcription factor [Brevibacterium]|uniref:Response regulator transcription factor n=1 Tax=Brevibacterium luteolum TaxID=199591 RepID=A0A849AVH4_9MICO|nr:MULTISPECIES: response regulator transcription factor [Brevibacterium]MBM7530310.1 DNA-binding NarL/FixJ family response regulator [Brevibacterium luteolum]MCT1657086.1 response regulator transcription factor [Brevibacterium luteolum]MCT1690775.1 response regulator transcription factor [Brevibacterium sp. p3-SID960]MCT1829693.1 response regulator transcription factor [Brevibacterium luteolum]MCT1873425.1 response regulator transcription factor [Brevibacterium luteolum]
MRIIIAEDAVLLREGLVRLLTDAGHEIVAAVGDANEFLAAINTAAQSPDGPPDLAIVDVRMPPTFTDEGIRAAVLVRSQNPEVGVIVLSQYVEERYARDLIADNSGGFGYLLKDRVADVEDFLAAVTEVAGGGTVLDPEVVSQILVRTRKQDGLSDLTAREREVLQLMAEGKSNSAIAGSLYLSAGAVEKHISSIFTKFGLMADTSENRRVLAVLRFLGA